MKTLASTKQGSLMEFPSSSINCLVGAKRRTVVQLVAGRTALSGLPLDGQGAAEVALHGLFVFIGAADVLAQQLADVAGYAHVLLRSAHAGAARGIRIEGDGDVLHRVLRARSAR